MSHPNGELALFNDCADGIAPSLAELERLAAELGIVAPAAAPSLTHLAVSGYVRQQQGAAVLLADVAPLGPDYLVGHAHADTLSFELSLGTQRLVVNGGTSCYGLGSQRLVERGTAAHSTVTLAGQNSSEIWSGFRVGRRARPVALRFGASDFSCAHDGYRHLPGRPLHRRTWQLSAQALRVDDETGSSPHAAVARYPLAAGLCLHALGPGQYEVRRGMHTIASVEVAAGHASIENTQHAHRFGICRPNQTLAVVLAGGRATTCWRWNTDAHSLSH